jgi:hypothetical protein
MPSTSLQPQQSKSGVPITSQQRRLDPNAQRNRFCCNEEQRARRSTRWKGPTGQEGQANLGPSALQHCQSEEGNLQRWAQVSDSRSIC